MTYRHSKCDAEAEQQSCNRSICLVFLGSEYTYAGIFLPSRATLLYREHALIVLAREGEYEEQRFDAHHTSGSLQQVRVEQVRWRSMLSRKSDSHARLSAFTIDLMCHVPFTCHRLKHIFKLDPYLFAPLPSIGVRRAP